MSTISRTSRIAPAAVSALLVSTALALLPAEGKAATAGEAVAPDDGQVAEIVVTANRREQRLQDVGVSAAVANGVKLDELNIARPEDLVRLVPGLTSIPNAGSAASSFAIRGVGQSDFDEHQEQPVAVYQDGVYISLSSASGFPIFDIDRTEVLRGPQGTLFGRNATGGLIQFYSKQPTGALTGGISATLGDRDLRRFQGYLSGGNDLVQGRLALYHSEQDGYVKNNNGDNLIGENIDALRAQIRFTPDDATKITLRLEGFSENGTSSANKSQPAKVVNGYGVPIGANENVYGLGPGLDITGFRDNPDLLDISVDDPGTIRKRSHTVALSASRDFGNLTVYSVTAYTFSDVAYREDSDGRIGVLQSYGDGGKSYTFSQELRLQQNLGDFRWTSGIYLLDINGSYYIHSNFPHLCDAQNTEFCSFTNNGTEIFDLTNGKGAVADTAYRLRTSTAAAFAQGEYDITDQLTVTGGVRATYDDQRFNYLLACSETLAGACSTIFGNSGPGLIGPWNLRQDFGTWNAKGEIDYKVAPDELIYATFNRGTKSSSYFADASGVTPANKTTILPEVLTDYEVGVKSAFFNRRLIVNFDAFYYDYKNFQTFSFNGVSTSVVNLPAVADGGELEITGRPGDDIKITGGLAFDDFRVHDVTTPIGLQTQKAINAPKYQANWSISKGFTLPDETSLVLSYNGRYTGDRYFSIVNGPVTKGEAVTLHDLTLSVIHDRLTINAYCTNFTDVHYSLINFDQSFEGFYLQHPAEPRTFGVTVGYDF